MRIGVGLQACRFGALIRAPNLGPAKEEALLRRKAVDVFRALAFNGLFVGGVSNGQAAEVTDAFA